LVLCLFNIIKDLSAKEISELANKFKDFEVAQVAILTRQTKFQLLFKDTPFKVPPKACWQPPPKKKHSKANQ